MRKSHNEYGKNSDQSYFGQLLRQFRDRVGLTQAELAEQLHVHGATVSRWERSARPTDVETIRRIGDLLVLSQAELDLLVLAGGHGEVAEEVGRIRAETIEIRGTLSTVSQQLGDMWSLLNGDSPVAMPVGFRGALLSALKSTSQKVSWPLAYLLLVGVILQVAGVSVPAAPYIGPVMLLVLARGFLNLQAGTKRDADRVSLTAETRSQVGELLFVSLFFILTTPLLQTSRTGMDIYGFYAIPSITGTVAVAMYAALLDLGLAAFATFSFFLIWDSSAADRFGPYSRAALAVGGPVLLAYIPAAIFATTGGEIYYGFALAMLFAAIVMITAFRDNRVRLSAWESRLAVYVVIAAIFVLSTLSILGMVVVYLEREHAVPDHNKLWSWPVNWELLGYSKDEFANRLRAGFLWMAAAGISYMTLGIGGYLLATIHRFQINRQD